MAPVVSYNPLGTALSFGAPSASHKVDEYRDVLVQLAAEDGLWQDAIVANYELWLPKGLLTESTWTLPRHLKFLEKAIAYDPYRTIKVSLAGVSPTAMLKKLVQVAPDARDITLEGTRLISAEDVGILAGFSQLERLSVASMEALGQAEAKALTPEQFPALESLDVSSTKIVDMKWLAPMLPQLRELTAQQLRLFDAHPIVNTKLETLDLRYSRLHADAAKGIIANVPLKHLKVSDNIDVADLAPLKGLVTLEANAKNDAELEALTGMNRLKELVLFDSKITDIGINHVVELGALTKLDISGTEVRNPGLAAIAKSLPLLQKLLCYDLAVDDSGAVHLGKLTELQFLNLIETNVGDATLRALANCTKLEELWLGSSDTAITLAGLASIATLPALAVLGINGVKATRAELQELRLLEAADNSPYNHFSS